VSDRETETDQPQGLGPTLAVIALIAAVVGAGLLATRGDEGSGAGVPAGSTTTSETTLEMPTISEEDFPSETPKPEPTPSPEEPSPDAPRTTPAEVPSDPFAGLPTDPADYESWLQDNLEQMAR